MQMSVYVITPLRAWIFILQMADRISIPFLGRKKLQHADRLAYNTEVCDVGQICLL